MRDRTETDLQKLTAALNVAREEVQQQHKQLDSVGTPGAYGEGVLTRETAILQAKVMRELSAALEKAAAQFCQASSESASALTLWTKVLAITTGVLAIAALMQAIDIISRW